MGTSVASTRFGNPRRRTAPRTWGACSARGAASASSARPTSIQLRDFGGASTSPIGRPIRPRIGGHPVRRARTSGQCTTEVVTRRLRPYTTGGPCHAAPRGSSWESPPVRQGTRDVPAYRPTGAEVTDARRRDPGPEGRRRVHDRPGCDGGRRHRGAARPPRRCARRLDRRRRRQRDRVGARRRPPPRRARSPGARPAGVVGDDRRRRHVHTGGHDRAAHGAWSPIVASVMCRCIDADRLAGVVSIGDIVAAHVRELEDETQLLHDYISAR